MRAFWKRGPSHDCAVEIDQTQAGLVWSDEVRGIRGDFLGLIDNDENTIQFYFDESIPDQIDDASDLRIVLMDFPQPEAGGSYAVHVAIGDVHRLIVKAFQVGADHRQFGELEFVRW
jgi:hypothetical protein